MRITYNKPSLLISAVFLMSLMISGCVTDSSGTQENSPDLTLSVLPGDTLQVELYNSTGDTLRLPNPGGSIEFERLNDAGEWETLSSDIGFITVIVEIPPSTTHELSFSREADFVEEIFENPGSHYRASMMVYQPGWDKRTVLSNTLELE